MSAATPNVAASVRARLLNVAKAQGVDFNQVLVRFALERILYRLTQSPHADRFLLKGALLFTLWYDMPHRATRDADLLGFGASDLESVAQVFRDIAAVPVDDGKRFGLAAHANASLVQRLMDPETNIRLSARYLAELSRMFSNEPNLIIAAYNAGEGAVRRYGNTIPPYDETQTYVAFVVQLYGAFRGREQEDLNLPGLVQRVVVPVTCRTTRCNPERDRDPVRLLRQLPGFCRQRLASRCHAAQSLPRKPSPA